MNYFPNGNEEIDLIKFLSKYQYLSISDVPYFFKSKNYYRIRINNLIAKNFLKKDKLTLSLDKLGIEYAKLFNFEYIQKNRDKRYIPRLLAISHFAAFYHKCPTINFTPSFTMKDETIFTLTARRYIGVIEINKIDYLTYFISKKHNDRYITSIVYDIQKEKQYKNILILVNDIKRIDVSKFVFGMNQVLIIEDNDENRECLKTLNSVNWPEIVKYYFKNKAFLSEYNYCDYTDYRNKYISTFYFLDTEKINRIKYFLRENKNKAADIICSKELKESLIKYLPSANYNIVNLEEYIDKEKKVYD